MESAWRKKKKKKKMPVCLLDRLQRISFFANKVADGIVYEETEILERTIPRMSGVMQRVAEYSCDYVQRGRFGRGSPGLDCVVANDRREDVAWVGPPEKIEEMEEELATVIEDFDLAVNVEALRLVKETSTQMVETSKQTLFSNRR